MSDGYLSLSATVVLQAVANGYGYGFDIMDATGLPSGTVYPALRRMDASGLVTAAWESAAIAQRDQRPARKYYDVTRSGRIALADAVSRYRLADRPPARVRKPAAAKR
jgi:PadR family transcriptional regulator, regulatory protein PadR